MRWNHAVAVVGLAWMQLVPPVFADPVDPNFALDFIQSGAGKTKIRFDFAGRAYVTEKRGRLLQIQPHALEGWNVEPPTVLLDLQTEVRSEAESGLLGLALDPEFATNRFVYLFFTTESDQRLVRYTLNESFDGIEIGSETILLSGLPRQYDIHNAGEIGIHPDDPFSIFVALGDDGDPSRAQNLAFYEGKILRVDSSTGLGVADNPWFDGNPDSIQSRVWSRGFRNPFRFTFHPTRADVLIVSENGDATDRVAWVGKGTDGEWNTGGDNGGFLSPDDPNFRVMFTGTPSLIGVAIAVDGPFAFNGEPTLYLGDWFPDGWGIRRFTMSGSDLSILSPISDGAGDNWWDENSVAVDLEFGPDGNLYFLETGGDAASDDWYTLRRHRFANGTPPTAALTTDPAPSVGEAPFQLEFMDASIAGTNPITAWHWDFGDGQTSSDENPVHQYVEEGRYTATLTVTDSVGLRNSVSTDVTVTATTPVSFNISLFDARALAASPLAAAVRVAFYQSDGITAVTIPGGLGPNQNQIEVPGGGAYVGIVSLLLTDDGFVISVGEENSEGLIARRMGRTVLAGIPTQVDLEAHLSDTAVLGQVRSVAGSPASVGIGVSTALGPLPFGGARDFPPESLIPPETIPHRTESDALGYYYVPVPTLSATATLTLNLAEDVGRGQYASATEAIALSPGVGTIQDFVLGEWNGGVGRDDLSGIPPTPSVSFAAIQQIFSNSCIGCHRQNTSNNGGLDLTEGNSFTELVDQPSLFAPGVKLVDPGNPGRSYLFEKINSAVPQQGARMRPSDAMDPTDQALIRDWIAQLLPTFESFVLENFGTPSDQPGSAVDGDLNGNGIANGIEFTGLTHSTPGVNSDSTTMDLSLNPNAEGISIAVRVSETLEAGSWTVLASRLRGEVGWRTGDGISITTPSQGIIRIHDASGSSPPRFYQTVLSED